MDILIDVAFVVAVTAFFRTQFGLTGTAVLIVAFAVTLLYSIAPLIGEALPVTVPWIAAVLQIFWLFVTAAGSVDAVSYFIRRK